MKRKVLVTMLCLAISVSAIACGTENTTEQQGVIATEQTAETEEAETETQEVETQETADNVEETENYDDYEELVSVPVDGRDGSKENPYQVGDTIYFPKVVIEYNNDRLEMMFSSLTIVVEEATSEYVKISYEFGIDSWEELDWVNWATSTRMVDMNSFIMPFREDREINQVGAQLDVCYSMNDMSDIFIEEADKTEVTLYYQDYDGRACTEDTAYLMLVYKKFSIPYEECYTYFNCTFIEVPKS